MRVCALGVWNADGGNVTPAHVEHPNSIYCKGNLVPAALYWELCTAVAEHPRLPGAAVFPKNAGVRPGVRAEDRPSVRGPVDPDAAALRRRRRGGRGNREAGFVNRCADALTALCDADGLPGDKPKLDARD